MYYKPSSSTSIPPNYSYLLRWTCIVIFVVFSHVSPCFLRFPSLKKVLIRKSDCFWEAQRFASQLFFGKSCQKSPGRDLGFYNGAK